MRNRAPAAALRKCRAGASNLPPGPHPPRSSLGPSSSSLSRSDPSTSQRASTPTGPSTPRRKELREGSKPHACRTCGELQNQLIVPAAMGKQKTAQPREQGGTHGGQSCLLPWSLLSLWPWCPSTCLGERSDALSQLCFHLGQRLCLPHRLLQLLLRQLQQLLQVPGLLLTLWDRAGWVPSTKAGPVLSTHFSLPSAQGHGESLGAGSVPGGAGTPCWPIRFPACH